MSKRRTNYLTFFCSNWIRMQHPHKQYNWARRVTRNKSGSYAQADMYKYGKLIKNRRNHTRKKVACFRWQEAGNLSNECEEEIRREERHQPTYK